MRNDRGAVVNSVCPRCGGAFHCGATFAQGNELGPCACSTVTLDPATRQALREAFDTCLCLACLRSLQPGSRPSSPPVAPAP